MPLSIRAKGVSLSTSTNWAFNFLVGEITPELQEVITWRLYPMHGFFCVCSFILGEPNSYMFEEYPLTLCSLLLQVFPFQLILYALIHLQCIPKPREFLLKKWISFSAKVKCIVYVLKF